MYGMAIDSGSLLPADCLLLYCGVDAELCGWVGLVWELVYLTCGLIHSAMRICILVSFCRCG